MSLDVSIKAAAAAVTLTMALAILAGDPRRATNRALAVFLLLLTGNQGAEALRGLAEDPVERLQWFRLATIFAALDPAAIVHFATVAPLGRRNLPAWSVWPALALSAIFASSAVFAAPPAVIGLDRDVLLRISLTIFTAVAYLLVLLAIVAALKDAPADGSLRLFVLAILVAALTSVGRGAGAIEHLVVETLEPSLGEARPEDFARTHALNLLAILVAAGVIHRRADPRIRRWILGASLAGISMFLLLTMTGTVDALRWLGVPLPPSDVFLRLGQAGSGIRWIAFSVIVAVATLKLDLLRLSTRGRLRAARVILGVAFVGTTVLALVLIRGVGNDLVGLRPLDGVLLGAMLLASQSSRRLLDALAARLFGVAPSAAAPSPHATPGPLAVGHVVADRYQIERLLGQGGSGRAFRATDLVVRRKVVLKETLSPEGSRAELLDEARLAGSLQHPNVVTLHDVLDGPGGVILVFEYVEGGSLADRIRTKGLLEPRDATSLAISVLQGLAAVHQRGIVHRDLKPSNVLLTAEDAPKISDFGIARLSEAMTRSDAVAGTPGFMSPEQRAGRGASEASDIYAMGSILQRVTADLPPGVAAAVSRAVADDPRDRWSSAREFREALERAAASEEWSVASAPAEDPRDDPDLTKSG